MEESDADALRVLYDDQAIVVINELFGLCVHRASLAAHDVRSVTTGCRP